MTAGWKRLASFFLLIKPNRLTNVLLLQAPWLARWESDARNIEREGKRAPKRTKITTKNSKRKKTQFAHKDCVEFKCFTLGQLNGTWEEVSTWINKVRTWHSGEPIFLLWFINLVEIIFSRTEIFSDPRKNWCHPLFLCRGFCKKFEFFLWNYSWKGVTNFQKRLISLDLSGNDAFPSIFNVVSFFSKS